MNEFKRIKELIRAQIASLTETLAANGINAMEEYRYIAGQLRAFEAVTYWIDQDIDRMKKREEQF